MSLATLRTQLTRVLPPPPAVVEALPTGIAELDAALRGGVPRGRVTELVAPLGAGGTSLLRQLVAATVGRGVGVAYVDAQGTLDPADWAPLDAGWLRMVRPADRGRAAWCADVLLRSGAFPLVVLDGAPPLPHEVAMRLAGLAREHDAALVVAGEATVLRVGVGVRLAVGRKRRWGGADGRLPGPTAHPPVPLRRLTVTLGSGSTLEVRHVVSAPRRLCAHPEVPDRRGVARGGRGARGGGDAAAAGAPRRWKGVRNGGQLPPRGAAGPAAGRAAG